jgi:phage-related protein
MSQFQGYAFDYNNNNSLNFDVFILDYPGSSGWQTNAAGSNVQMVTRNIKRRARQFVHGTEQNEQLRFQITVGCDHPRSRAEIDNIKAWLIGTKPAWLHIGQDDMREVCYFGMFTQPQLVSSGKRQFAIQFTFICTSPYAYTYPLKTEMDIGAIVQHKFVNSSSDSNYLFPKIIFAPTSTTTSFSIINEQDNNREMRFDFAPVPNGSEIITIDCDKKIITSSQGFNRFRDFNKNWLRLVRGENELTIAGRGTVIFEYRFARRVGA